MQRQVNDPCLQSVYQARDNQYRDAEQDNCRSTGMPQKLRRIKREGRTEGCPEMSSLVSIGTKERPKRCLFAEKEKKTCLREGGGSMHN